MSEPNPYQSPVSLDQPSELDGFYTSKLTALRYVELWRIANRWHHFAFAALAKTLRWTVPSNTAFKALEPIKLVDKSELPEKAREKLLPVVESCRELALQLAFYYTVERRDPNESYAAEFLNQSGTSSVMTNWVRVRAGQIVKEQLSCFVQSWLDDGGVLSTSNQRRMLDAPEMVERVHVPGASIADLLQIHTERLQTISPSRVLLLDRDRLLERLNVNKRLIAEFHIRRGFWVPKPAETVTVSAIT
ncbi:MAG TPA: hypothetical protein VJ783_18700 [Pirellulales bacterium]|nr:hypothetical protein [Pirellulales bacterium]